MSRPEDAVPAGGSLTPPQWARLLATINQFEPGARKRGTRYALEQRVTDVEVSSGLILGVVQGTERYEVEWAEKPRGWRSICSCPVQVNCKHAFAVVWQLVLRTHDVHTADRMPAPAPVPARARQAASLESIVGAPTAWQFEAAVAELFRSERGFEGAPYTLSLHVFAAEPDGEVRCWRLAHAILERYDGRLPRALEPFRTRPDLAARYADAQRRQLAQDVAVWAAQQKQAAQRHLRVVFGLATGIDDRAVVTVEVRLTTPRLADAPRSLQQLQQLRTDLQRMPQILSPDEAALLLWLVDHNLGASQFAPVVSPQSGTLRGLLDQVSDRGLASWGDGLDPQLAARAGVVPGAPVRRSLAPVRLVPDCVERDGAPWLALQFVWPDGTRRGDDAVVHLDRSDGHHGPSSFVLAGGVFSAVVVEPPPQLVERFRATGGIPLPASSRAPLLHQLGRGFPHLLDTLRAHTRQHAVHPAVLLDLHDDVWMQIRLLGVPDGWRPGQSSAGCFEYGPGAGWEKVTGETAARVALGGVDAVLPAVATDAAPGAPLPADASIASPAASADASSESPAAPSPAEPSREYWSDEPDAAAVAPGLEWLASTAATPGTQRGAWPALPPAPQNAVGWWLLLSARRLDALAAAWDARPDGVAFYGSERVRRLLVGAPVAPRLRVDASGMDWFSVSAEWEAEGMTLTEEDVAALRAAKTRFVKLSSGWVDRAAVAQHDETTEFLADLGLEVAPEPQRVTVWQLAGARPESLDALQRFGADPETLVTLERLRSGVESFAGLPEQPVPAALRAELRPYQREGLSFLSWTSSLDLGAILADDMGLGKTVQALAWLAHLRERDPDGGPTLVVCPASVVHNWERETARFLPDWRVTVLSSGAARHAQREAVSLCDLVVTNYALLRRDAAAWSEIPLRAVILDEAQNIKNPDAAVTKAAQRLRARHRLALTGTPLENRALDLWSLMDWVNPGYLGSRARFAEGYDRADTPPHRRLLLAARLRPVLLRRLKREVAQDLPDRIEERRDCELSPGQRRLYLAELRRSQGLLDGLSDDPAALGKQRIQILAALTRLRQICCHPALAGGAASLGSGKFDTLFELLEPLLAEGHKVLIFSQFVECLKLLAAEMPSRGIPFRMLTGQTTKRAAVVQAFTDDPQPGVFLVSLRAGGTGLNLTAASYVVLFDPWWNPAVEAQAIDRTHRIGQDRTVVAYRLVARGTIEDKIFDLQQRKQAMVQDVLGESGFGRSLTRDDLASLFAVE